jgi:hypothetical protein
MSSSSQLSRLIWTNNTIYSTAGAIVLRISHGYEVQEKDDPFVALADKANGEFSIASTPGAFLVDTFPACVCPSFYAIGKTHDTFFSAACTPMVPWWGLEEDNKAVVGNSSWSVQPASQSCEATTGEDTWSISQSILISIHQAAGTAPVSFSSTLLDRKDVSAEEDFDIKWASFSMYAGELISE